MILIVLLPNLEVPNDAVPIGGIPIGGIPIAAVLTSSVRTVSAQLDAIRNLGFHFWVSRRPRPLR